MPQNEYRSHAPPGNFYGNEAAVGMGTSFEEEGPHEKSKNSKVSVDIHQYQKDKFDQAVNDRQFQQTQNHDEIFMCYDWDENRQRDD